MEKRAAGQGNATKARPCGGRSLTDHPDDMAALLRTLRPIVRRPEGLEGLDDPLLADLIWRKGDRVAVVEVSRIVDEKDVERAARRAATLCQAGLPAFPMVIGRDWSSEEISRAAARSHVAWRVAEEKTDAYLAFRNDEEA